MATRGEWFGCRPGVGPGQGLHPREAAASAGSGQVGVRV